MFLYPALTLGFLFVGVPLLVHLINMLRHRRQRWAAMDFLLASYRKQKKWIHLRQILLLLSRLIVAALLIALLSGWSGGSRILDAIGGRVTHHVVILDDSYSMGDRSTSGRAEANSASAASLPSNSQVQDTSADGVTAYARALSTLQDLTRYLANQDGEHQLTVMRASRAAMSVRAGSATGDAAADISSQTVEEDARLINRVMATSASSLEVDLVPALDLASELLRSTPADDKFFYVLSDFRERSWGAADRLAESLGVVGKDVPIRLIDCAEGSSGNLAITSLVPSPDVWVAGVPVMIRVTVRNYGDREVRNVPLTVRSIRYPDQPINADPSAMFSGQAEVLPDLMFEVLEAGEEVTKTFQVYIAEAGTHAIEVELPQDALLIDNRRFCTLPLSRAEKVLVIDADVDGVGGYHVSSSLNPGSQVEVGVIPEMQPPSFLRSITYQQLSDYRAVYLIDLPEVSDNAADALTEYVQRGGGLAWFLGKQVDADAYNRVLLTPARRLLPAPLGVSESLDEISRADGAGDVLFTEGSDLFGPLRSAGDGILSLVSVAKSWSLVSKKASSNQGTRVETGNPADAQSGEVIQDGVSEDSVAEREVADDSEAVYQVALKLRDGRPLLTQHSLGRGRVLTHLVGLDGSWTNWSGDPTFVVSLLQANAWLWSAAAPPVSREVEMPYRKRMLAADYLRTASFLPPVISPPRVPFEISALDANAADLGSAGADPSVDAERYEFILDPAEMLIRGDEHLDEILEPGLSEWGFIAADGTARVVPEASVIDSADGDLERAEHAAVLQQLSPLNVQFLQRRSWNQDDQVSQNSSMTVMLLLLLLAFLAVEQGLAYWASYHVSTSSAVSGHRSRVGGQHRGQLASDTSSDSESLSTVAGVTSESSRGGLA